MWRSRSCSAPPQLLQVSSDMLVSIAVGGSRGEDAIPTRLVVAERVRVVPGGGLQPDPGGGGVEAPGDLGRQREERGAVPLRAELEDQAEDDDADGAGRFGGEFGQTGLSFVDARDPGADARLGQLGSPFGDGPGDAAAR